MTSKIEDTIDELARYIEDCPSKMFSEDIIQVSRGKMDKFIMEMHKNIPEEVEQHRKVLSQKEAILENAKAKAQQIVDRAQKYTDDMVNEHQIMHQAFAQAEEIVRQATEDAQKIIDRANYDAANYVASANAYLDDKLAEIEELLSSTIETAQSRNQSFILNLQKSLQTVVANRAEMRPEQEDLAVAERAEADRLAAEAAMNDELSLDIMSMGSND